MYRFKIGDKVRHIDQPELTGVITKLVSFNEDTGNRVNRKNQNNPWYDISWETSIDSEFENDGFECDDSLELNQ